MRKCGRSQRVVRKKLEREEEELEAQGSRSTESECTDVAMASEYVPGQALYGYT